MAVAPSSGADAGGPKKTPSPVEECSGFYSCGRYPSSAKNWLHSDGKSCFYGMGTSYVLTADGRVDRDGKEDGSWSGDAKYFEIRWTTGDSTTCELLPE